ncbi:universal stress protein [Haloferax prahovense]|uniref:universal stress protein n=1 Tax=Haloferax prahovense TaxID=381852 RepID=UPI003C78CBB1
MENALVVVEDTIDSKELVREAASFAAAEEATLYLFVMVSKDELERTVSTLERIGEVENTSYSADTALGGATAFLEGVANEALADIDVEYERVCSVVDDSDRSTAAIQAANENDCDHVFTTGSKRSPTGKALFGDFVQSLILSFDGRVTVDLQ